MADNYLLLSHLCRLHPQALYKLYNVAANHRHLYHHAFPGHQVEEAVEERDKKRD